MRSLAALRAGLSFPAIAFLLGFLWVVSALPARAEVLLVPEDHSIEEALTIAQPGDEISVAAGTLTGGALVLPDGITLVSREVHTNRLEFIDLSGLSTGVEIVGFLVGYENSDDGYLAGGRQGVRIDGSRVRFTQCLFQYLIPYGVDFLPPGIPPGDQIPLRYSMDSEVEFHQCTFRSNYLGGGGGHRHSIAVHCVGSFGAAEPSGRLGFYGCLFDDQASPIFATVPVDIIDCHFLGNSQYLITAEAGLRLEGCLVADFALTDIIDCAFHDCYGYTRAIEAGGKVEIHGNTFVDTQYWHDEMCFCPVPSPAETDAVVTLRPGAVGSITNNLFIGQPGAAVDAPAAIAVACNDAFESADVNWRGGIGGVTGIAGNISQAPLFCGRANGDYTISIYSPAAAENNECGLMGAFGTACDIQVSTTQTSWGAFKGRFQKKTP